MEVSKSKSTKLYPLTRSSIQNMWIDQLINSINLKNALSPSDLPMRVALQLFKILMCL